MKIKKHIKRFNEWQEQAIGYNRYRLRNSKTNGDSGSRAIDVYTKGNECIKMRRLVKGEGELIDEILKIVELYEGPIVREMYEKLVEVDSEGNNEN